MAQQQVPNFNFKNEIPFATIIDNIVQKPMRESQLQNDQQSRFDSQFNEVQAVANKASETVQSFVEASKQRQKRDAQNTLASILSSGGDQVPTGKMVPAASSAVPQLTQAPTTQAYSQTPDFVSKVAGALPKAYPEEFGKQVSEYASKALFGGLGMNGGKTYAPQQAAIQVTDPVTGRLKTVAVTFANGKYYNPITSQEISDPSELANLPERGYAQGYRPAGYDKNGNEIVSEERSGKKFIVQQDPAGGQPTYVPYDQKIYPKLENVPQGMTDALAELNYSQKVLGQIAKTFDPNFVGPLAARAGKMTKYLDSLTDEQRVDFYANMAEYKNSIIKAITGAQMSETEAKRIVQQIPDENASPKAFSASLQRAYRMTDQRIRSKMQSMAESGYVSRGDLPSPISADELANLFDEKLKTAGISETKERAPSINININSKKVQKLFDELGETLKAGRRK